MTPKNLTRRDREYLISIFLLNGHEYPVGPAKLARKRNMSRAGALKKMKRLERCDVGEYIPEKGLKLNSQGKKIVENEILRHHMVENFFQKSLDMDFEDACKEAEKLGFEMSGKIIDLIDRHYGDEIESECGLDLEPPFEPEDVIECPWCERVLEQELSER